MFYLWTHIDINSKNLLKKIKVIFVDFSLHHDMVLLLFDFLEQHDIDQIANPTLKFSLMGDDSFAWSLVWRLLEHSMRTWEVDKELMTSLRDIRTILTADHLDQGIILVRMAISERFGVAAAHLLKRLEGNRLKNLLKALLQIGAFLSQTREFRDVFEDLLAKVMLSILCGVFLINGKCNNIIIFHDLRFDCVLGDRTAGGIWHQSYRFSTITIMLSRSDSWSS